MKHEIGHKAYFQEPLEESQYQIILSATLTREIAFNNLLIE
jgi:hypothetical protein